MCVIIDANAIADVFGARRTPAGATLFRWLGGRRGRMVVGGKLRRELTVAGKGFRQWAQQAARAGKMQVLQDAVVSERTEAVERAKGYLSDDPHILALAQVSGARILFSRDERLRRDFTNPALVARPRGTVFSAPDHRHLLDDEDLCRRSREANPPLPSARG